MKHVMAAAAVFPLMAGMSPAAAQSAGQAYVDIATHMIIDDKCKLLAPVERLALELTRVELEPQLSQNDVSLITQRLAQVQGMAASKPCNDPMLAAARDPIRQAGNYYQAVWSARVKTAADLRSSTLWATWSPVVGIKRSAAEQRLKEWGVTRPGGEAQLLATTRPETTRMFAVLCPELSSDRTKCPALSPPAATGEAAWAKSWGERVNRFASSLGGARLDGQPVLPAGVTDWASLFTPLSLDMALIPGVPRQECKVGMVVAKVTGSSATLYNTRDGFKIGEGEVSPMGAILSIRSPQLGGVNTAQGLIGCKTP